MPVPLPLYLLLRAQVASNFCKVCLSINPLDFQRGWFCFKKSSKSLMMDSSQNFTQMALEMYSWSQNARGE